MYTSLTLTFSDYKTYASIRLDTRYSSIDTFKLHFGFQQSGFHGTGHNVPVVSFIRKLKFDLTPGLGIIKT